MLPILLLTIFPLLSQSMPQIPEDYDIFPESEIKPPQGICSLPSYLGFTGSGKLLSDCKTLDRFRQPPCNVYAYTANQAKVCLLFIASKKY